MNLCVISQPCHKVANMESPKMTLSWSVSILTMLVLGFFYWQVIRDEMLLANLLCFSSTSHINWHLNVWESILKASTLSSNIVSNIKKVDIFLHQIKFRLYKGHVTHLSVFVPISMLKLGCLSTECKLNTIELTYLNNIFVNLSCPACKVPKHSYNCNLAA